MNFALRCARIFPDVNSRAELVNLVPGLRPERRFAGIITAETQVFTKKALNSSRLAEESLCLRKRLTLEKGIKLVHANSLPRPRGTTFEDLCNRTKT